MKRLALLAAVGALLVGVASPAAAQQAPSFTVTFGGQLRVAAIAYNNLTDFRDTGKADCTGSPAPGCKDSGAWFHERFRLFTTIESADKKARAYWALEVGDYEWGGRLGSARGPSPNSGGASGGEYGGSGTRTGQNCCGGLGADAVSVETKNLYIWFDTSGLVPGTNVLLGTHNIVFLNTPIGAFMDDDGSGIQLNFKFDPIDVQIYMVMADENNLQDADDNTMYSARVGVNITKDLRLTVEGLVVDEQCFTRRPAGTLNASGAGSCVKVDFGDTFWVGGTVGIKIANINLDGTAVYGQRKLFSAANSTGGGKEIIEEKGFGANLVARVPIGPLSTWFVGWYTTGDENRIAGGSASAPGPTPAGALTSPRVQPKACQDFTVNSNTTRLCKDSDKLPIPIAGASWLGAPFVGEALNHSRTTGNISSGQPFYNDWTGTWGVGGSATFAVTPAFSVGGGVAYVRATETTNAAGGDNGIFGDSALEIDAGVLYTFNPQLSFQLVGSYIIPDAGDDAWALYARSVFAF
ncbi:MAG TPA: hypothetical protein VGX21_04595 [Methylomirabilota bacterium]|jgi:hypothetical protein|nr:hypothetical protein [Methylomirabilota bacterium]